MFALVAVDSGTTILDLSETESPVHPDLKWVEVPEETTHADQLVEGEVVKYVAPPPAPQVFRVAVEQLCAVLVSKGLLTTKDIAAAQALSTTDAREQLAVAVSKASKSVRS